MHVNRKIILIKQIKCIWSCDFFSLCEEIKLKLV